MPYIQLLQLLFLTLASSWTLSFEDNGITGYTRHVDHSKYLEYRLEMTCKGTVKEALDAITDINNYEKLYPFLGKIELLSEPHPTEFDVLLVIKTPFPAKNRIGVYSNQIKHISPVEARIAITQKSELIPDSKYVNIEECYGSWDIKAVDQNQVRIVHQFFADPGGSIPAWIINAFALKHPKNTFKTLKKQLQK